MERLISEILSRYPAFYCLVSVTNGCFLVLWNTISLPPNRLSPGSMKVRRFWRSGSTFTGEASFSTVADATGTSRYFALEGHVYGQGAPQAGTTTKIDLRHGSRYVSPKIQGQALWYSHPAGIDGTDGKYDGDETGNSVDRSGIRWARYIIGVGGSITHVKSDIIRDNSQSAPYWYYFPSLAVNNAGRAVAGFNISKGTEYIGAAYVGIEFNDTYPDGVRLLHAGMNLHSVSREFVWGDYSTTVLDPADTASFWTTEAFAPFPIDESWATCITRVSVR